MAMIENKLLHCLVVLIVLMSNTVCQNDNGDSANRDIYVYGEGHLAPSDFMPPTPYLPNNGEYVYEDYENRYPFSDAIPCDQRKRCQRRHQNYELVLKDQNCFCDNLCRAYSDCCVDYEPDEEAIAPILLDTDMASCGIVREIDQENPILLVDKCPRDINDDYLRDQCETFYESEGFLNLPVSGNRSGILYKNVYCAICTGESDIDFWSVEYQCRSAPPSAVNIGSEDADAKIALDETLQDPQNCVRIYKHNQHTTRYCKPDVISKCDRRFKDKRIKRRCKSETDTSYVYHAQARIFKNIYCAVCNLVNETHASCIDDVTSPRKRPISYGPLAMPFSVLLDLNKGSAGVSVRDNVGLDGRYEKTEIVMDFRRCAKHHVYDPFTRMCRLVGCRDGQMFKDGLCVLKRGNNNRNSRTTVAMPRQRNPKTTNRPKSNFTHRIADINTVISTTDSYFLFPELDTSLGNMDDYDYTARDLGCPKISYSKAEYRLLQNNSVFIKSSEIVYDIGNYDIISDMVYVCSPFSAQTYNVTYNETQVIIMFKFSGLQSLISCICLLISLVALITVFVIYMIFPTLRNIAGKCLVSLVVALFCAHLIFLVGTQQTDIPLVCNIIGAALHYFFLAAFFWMNVLALDICTTFTSKTIRTDDNSPRFVFYSLYAWIMPAIIVGGSVALDILKVVPEQYQPHYATELCWISRRDALFYLFALPIGIILLINFILFVITTISICVITRSPQMVQQKRKKVGLFVLYVKLGLILGLTWIFGFVASLTDYNVLWYVFIALNALQGLFICIAFVCTRKVFGLIASLGKPVRSKGATAGGYYACPNGGTNGSATRHTGTTHLYDSANRIELEAQETSI